MLSVSFGAANSESTKAADQTISVAHTNHSFGQKAPLDTRDTVHLSMKLMQGKAIAEEGQGGERKCASSSAGWHDFSTVARGWLRTATRAFIRVGGTRKATLLQCSRLKSN